MKILLLACSDRQKLVQNPIFHLAPIFVISVYRKTFTKIGATFEEGGDENPALGLLR